MFILFGFKVIVSRHPCVDTTLFEYRLFVIAIFVIFLYPSLLINILDNSFESFVISMQSILSIEITFPTL